MSKIKLVVSDLDDTFLTKEKKIIPGLTGCVDELKQKGILFSFISGRPPFGIKPYTDQVTVTGPVVSCNGALIYQKEEIITRHSFSMAPLKDLMERAVDMGMTVLFYRHDTEYTLSETDWTKKRLEWGRVFPVKSMSPDDWEHFRVEKINFMADPERNNFGDIQQELEKMGKIFSIAVYEGYGCEIAAPGINKAEGLKELCSVLGISLEQVLAVGDNTNDIEMIREAGVGAAVANAVEQVKSAAAYVCENPYGFGVIEAIKKFC